MESDSNATRALVQQALQLAQELERRAGLTSSETGSGPPSVTSAGSDAPSSSGADTGTAVQEVSLQRTLQALRSVQVSHVQGASAVTPGLQSPGPNGGTPNVSQAPPAGASLVSSNVATRTLQQRPPVTPILAPAPVVAPAAPTLPTPNSVLRHAAARSNDGAPQSNTQGAPGTVPTTAATAESAAQRDAASSSATVAPRTHSHKVPQYQSPAGQAAPRSSGAGVPGGEAAMSPELSARLKASPMLRLAHENLKLKAQLAAAVKRSAADKAISDARAQCAYSCVLACLAAAWCVSMAYLTRLGVTACRQP